MKTSELLGPQPRPWNCYKSSYFRNSIYRAHMLGIQILLHATMFIWYISFLYVCLFIPLLKGHSGCSLVLLYSEGQPTPLTPTRLRTCTDRKTQMLNCFVCREGDASHVSLSALCWSPPLLCFHSSPSFSSTHSCPFRAKDFPLVAVTLGERSGDWVILHVSNEVPLL